MKITLEIPDEELKEAVKDILADRLARNAFDEIHGARYFVSREVKEIIRGILKEHYDELADKAVAAASKSIENRAVKKLLDKLQEESA